MDKLILRDLRIDMHIGCTPEERALIQTLVLNIELELDLYAACVSDDLHDTADYAVLTQLIQDYAAQAEIHLIERVAYDITQICLKQNRVRAVTVTVDKAPLVLSDKLRSTAVTIHRVR